MQLIFIEIHTTHFWHFVLHSCNFSLYVRLFLSISIEMAMMTRSTAHFFVSFCYSSSPSCLTHFSLSRSSLFPLYSTFCKWFFGCIFRYEILSDVNHSIRFGSFLHCQNRTKVSFIIIRGGLDHCWRYVCVRIFFVSFSIANLSIQCYDCNQTWHQKYKTMEFGKKSGEDKKERDTKNEKARYSQGERDI